MAEYNIPKKCNTVKSVLAYLLMELDFSLQDILLKIRYSLVLRKVLQFAKLAGKSVLVTVDSSLHTSHYFSSKPF